MAQAATDGKGAAMDGGDGGGRGGLGGEVGGGVDRQWSLAWGVARRSWPAAEDGDADAAESRACGGARDFSDWGILEREIESGKKIETQFFFFFFF